VTASTERDRQQVSAPKRRISPALVLFFLSPVTAELLSGSSPPTEFFRPFPLLLLCLLYGSGAILIRELALRWRKGWPSIVMLGAAYGIVEEGLMVKSFFDPQWVDIGPLGVYGRWVGVNWVWSLGLTIFHTVWSIAIPILLVTLMFPRRAKEPWIGRRMFRALAVLLVADVVLGFTALTPYRPPAIPYLMAILAVIVLHAVARRMPAAFRKSHPLDAAVDKSRSLAFFAAGLAGAVAFFILLWAVPNTKVGPLGDMALMLLLVVTVWLILRRGSSASRWDARYQLAVASGALAFLILLAPLLELDPARAVEMRGMALVGLAMAVFLAWLGWRTRRFERDGVLPAALSNANPEGVTPFAT
jgi:hypothetical protein